MPHPGLPGIGLGDEIQGCPVEFHLGLLQAVLCQCLGNQVLLGNLHLLLVNVAGEGDDLRPVQQGIRDGVQGVGGEDEEDVGHVKGQVQVIVPEGDVLLRVQHLQQGTGRVPLMAHAHLVHLVNEEDGTGTLDYLQSLYNLAGHCPHVGAAVSLDFRLVPHSPHGKAEEGLVHGAGNGAAHAGLSHAGRPHQDDDGALAVLLQLSHRQILQDALFHIVQPVVVLLQDGTGLLQIVVLSSRHFFGTVRSLGAGPRKAGDGLQIVAHHIVFGGA